MIHSSRSAFHPLLLSGRSRPIPGGERDARPALNRTFNEGGQAPAKPVHHEHGQTEQNYPGSTSFQLVEAVLPTLRLDHAPTVFFGNAVSLSRVFASSSTTSPLLGRTEAVPTNGFWTRPVAPSAAAIPRNQPVPCMTRRTTCILLRCIARRRFYDDVGLSWAERPDACGQTSSIASW